MKAPAGSARRKRGVQEDLRQAADRLSVERLLSETTVLRVTLDFIEEKGIGDEFVRYLERRSR
ncbi:MAG: hypothetical protein JXB32_14810 [Deltaproteobacteria bacterium]|nr:hypothetical protein [Deltaproteobacteria bacterium]